VGCFTCEKEVRWPKCANETTTNLIGNGTFALLRNPDQLRLRAEPARIPAAVEELLRYDSPVQFTTRILTEPLVIGGKELPKDAFVLLGLGAANRDPEQFPDPDRLDVGRADNKHLSFGLGTHFCLRHSWRGWRPRSRSRRCCAGCRLCAWKERRSIERTSTCVACKHYRSPSERHQPSSARLRIHIHRG